jgi:hypothetical protein
MKRLVSLDWFKGFGILVMVMGHALMFNTDNPVGYLQSSEDFANLAAFVTSFGGMFALVSGMANALSMYGRYRNGKTTPKKILVNSMISGSIIVLLNYVYMEFFTPGLIMTDFKSIGMLPGVIKTGAIVQSTLPEMERVLYSTALVMIGWSVMFSGIFLYALIRKGGEQKVKRNFVILGTCATICVFIYPLLQIALRPFMAGPLDWFNFWGALVVSWLVGPAFPMFPYLGFCLYGIIFGMLLVDGAKRKTILAYGYGLGWTYMGLGIFLINFIGFTATPMDVPHWQVLPVVLGAILLVTTFTLHIMDLSSDKAKSWWIQHSKGIRACGIIGLTAFLLEASLSAVGYRVIQAIAPGTMTNLSFTVLVFAPIMAVIWLILVKLWTRVGFKGSFEWMIDHLMGKLTGKKSTRLDTGSIIMSADAYMEQPVVPTMPVQEPVMGK